MSEPPHSPEPSPEIADGSQLRIPKPAQGLCNQVEEGFITGSPDESPGEERSTNTGSTVAPDAADAADAADFSNASLPEQARAGLAQIKEMRAKGLLRDNR